MRKLIASEFVTLDGVMQAPGGKDENRDGGFEHGGRTWPIGTTKSGGAHRAVLRAEQAEYVLDECRLARTADSCIRPARLLAATTGLHGRGLWLRLRRARLRWRGLLAIRSDGVRSLRLLREIRDVALAFVFHGILRCVALRSCSMGSPTPWLACIGVRNMRAHRAGFKGAAVEGREFRGVCTRPFLLWAESSRASRRAAAA